MSRVLRTLPKIAVLLSLPIASMAANSDEATLSICNKSSQTLYFSMFRQQEPLDTDDNWKAQGVYDVASNDCLTVFETNDQIIAYIAFVKLENGNIVHHDGAYSSNTEFATGTDKDVCMTARSFKYFTTEEGLSVCKEDFFKTKSHIFMNIDATPEDSIKDHKLFIE
jgi:hypothetical protein